MKRFIITILALTVLVGSAFAKTTKVGDKQYHIKNDNMDLVCEVMSETEALVLTSTLLSTIGTPNYIKENSTIDPEVESLAKKFGYVLYHDDACVIIHVYNENTNCIDTVAWF